MNIPERERVKKIDNRIDMYSNRTAGNWILAILQHTYEKKEKRKDSQAFK